MTTNNLTLEKISPILDPVVKRAFLGHKQGAYDQLAKCELLTPEQLAMVKSVINEFNSDDSTTAPKELKRRLIAVLIPSNTDSLFVPAAWERVFDHSKLWAPRECIALSCVNKFLYEWVPKLLSKLPPGTIQTICGGLRVMNTSNKLAHNSFEVFFNNGEIGSVDRFELIRGCHSLMSLGESEPGVTLFITPEDFTFRDVAKFAEIRRISISVGDDYYCSRLLEDLGKYPMEVVETMTSVDYIVQGFPPNRIAAMKIIDFICKESENRKAQVMLVPNGIFKGSRNKSYDEQRELVEKARCQIPKAWESLAFCVLTSPPKTSSTTFVRSSTGIRGQGLLSIGRTTSRLQIQPGLLDPYPQDGVLGQRELSIHKLDRKQPSPNLFPVKIVPFIAARCDATAVVALSCVSKSIRDEISNPVPAFSFEAIAKICGPSLRVIAKCEIPPFNGLELIRACHTLMPLVEDAFGLTLLVLGEDFTPQKMMDDAARNQIKINTYEEPDKLAGTFSGSKVRLLLVTNSIFNNTRELTYDKMQTFVEKVGCEIPEAWESMTLCALSLANGQTNIYNKPNTRTYGCSSTLEAPGFLLTVGCVTSKGFNVYDLDAKQGNEYTGVGGVRRFEPLMKMK